MICRKKIDDWLYGGKEDYKTWKEGIMSGLQRKRGGLHPPTRENTQIKLQQTATAEHFWVCNPTETRGGGSPIETGPGK